MGFLKRSLHSGITLVAFAQRRLVTVEFFTAVLFDRRIELLSAFSVVRLFTAEMGTQGNTFGDCCDVLRLPLFQVSKRICFSMYTRRDQDRYNKKERRSISPSAQSPCHVDILVNVIMTPDPSLINGRFSPSPCPLHTGAWRRCCLRSACRLPECGQRPTT